MARRAIRGYIGAPNRSSFRLLVQWTAERHVGTTDTELVAEFDLPARAERGGYPAPNPRELELWRRAIVAAMNSHRALYRTATL